MKSLVEVGPRQRSQKQLQLERLAADSCVARDRSGLCELCQLKPPRARTTSW